MNPAAGWQLHLADSELARAERLGDDRLCLVWSAAWLSHGPRSGLARGVTLLLWLPQRMPWPDLADAFGRVREGRVQVAGRWQHWLPLNQTVQAPPGQRLTLELQLPHGVHLQLALPALRCEGPEPPQLRDSLAC